MSADFRLPPWQRTGSHLRRRHGQIGRIRLQTAAPSTVFSRFGPLRLFLFPNLKKSLAGHKFESNEEFIAATEAYFAELQKTYFSDGLKKLEHRWVKCIELKGDYVEKQIATFPKFSFFFCRLSTYRTALVSTAFLHEQWANCPCSLIYRTIFFFRNSCEPELSHRLQTSKMRRNSTSLNSCQHDDINIVTVSVARRRWRAPLKPRRPCVKHFTTFYALVKHVSPKDDYFTPKGHYFAS